MKVLIGQEGTNIPYFWLWHSSDGTIRFHITSIENPSGDKDINNVRNPDGWTQVQKRSRSWYKNESKVVSENGSYGIYVKPRNISFKTWLRNA